MFPCLYVTTLTIDISAVPQQVCTALQHACFLVPCPCLRGNKSYTSICILQEVYNRLDPDPAQHHACLLGQELIRLGIPDVHVNAVYNPKELVHVGSY